jgi:hypothetical protein
VALVKWAWHWSKGTQIGCISAVVLTLLSLMPLLFGMLWGGAHCEPVPACQRQNEIRTVRIALGVLGGAAVFGLIVRWSINSTSRD